MRRSERACRGTAPEAFGSGCGFTVVEIAIVIALIGILAAIAVPSYVTYREKARIAMTIAEIKMIERDIAKHLTETGEYPATLAEVGHDTDTDAWGHPYRYLKLAGEDPNGGIKGMRRRDRNANPVNSDYDLYSVGRDGQTSAQFKADAAHDDIVRARDGAYVGPAANYH